MNRRTQFCLLVGSLIGSSVFVAPAHSQDPPAPAQVLGPGATQAWHADGRLNTKITLEAKRTPLAEVVAALSKQSGVALDGGALSTTKRVTLSVTDMDVREAMAALEDLYQSSWQPQGEHGYVLRERVMQPWQRRLAQLGNIDKWGYYRTNWSRPFAPPYLTARYAFDWQSLMQELGDEALESPQGVAFSSLPLATQKEVRRVASWDIQHQAVEATALRDHAEQGWLLQIRPDNYPHPSITKNFRVPIPAKLGPLVGEVTSGDRPLASFDLRSAH